MEELRQIHRRSAYERVILKINYYESWSGPLPAQNQSLLDHLYALRSAIRKEMVAAGQIEEAPVEIRE